MVVVKDLYRRSAPKTVLDGISLTVGEGEIWPVMEQRRRQDHASTLHQRSIEPTSGTVTVDGIPRRAKRPDSTPAEYGEWSSNRPLCSRFEC